MTVRYGVLRDMPRRKSIATWTWLRIDWRTSLSRDSWSQPPPQAFHRRVSGWANLNKLRHGNKISLARILVWTPLATKCWLGWLFIKAFTFDKAAWVEVCLKIMQESAPSMPLWHHAKKSIPCNIPSLSSLWWTWEKYWNTVMHERKYLFLCHLRLQIDYAREHTQ